MEADLGAVSAAGHGAPAAVAGGGAVQEAQCAAVRSADAYAPDLGGQKQVDGVLGDERQRECGVGREGAVPAGSRRSSVLTSCRAGLGVVAADRLSSVTSPDAGSRPAATASTARSTASRSRRAELRTAAVAGSGVPGASRRASRSQPIRSSGPRSVSSGVVLHRLRRVLAKSRQTRPPSQIHMLSVAMSPFCPLA